MTIYCVEFDDLTRIYEHDLFTAVKYYNNAEGAERVLACTLPKLTSRVVAELLNGNGRRFIKSEDVVEDAAERGEGA